MKPGLRAADPSETSRPCRSRASRAARARQPTRLRLRAALVIAPLALGIAALVACSSQPSPAGPGEECFEATDCQAGLVCIPQPSGSRLCSNDLSKVAGRPPPEAGAADTGGDGPKEGAPADGPQPQDTSVPDTNVPDTSPPPKDASADG